MFPYQKYIKREAAYGSELDYPRDRRPLEQVPRLTERSYPGDYDQPPRTKYRPVDPYRRDEYDDVYGLRPKDPGPAHRRLSHEHNRLSTEHSYSPPRRPYSSGHLDELDRKHVDPRALDHRNIKPRALDHIGLEPRALDQRGLEPRGLDHRNIKPRGLDHIGLEPRALDQRGLEPRGLDHRNIKPRALDHIGLEPRALDQRGLEPSGLDHRNIKPRALDHIGLAPRALDQRGLEPRGLDQRDLEPRGLDHRGLKPRGLKHRHLSPNHREYSPERRQHSPERRPYSPERTGLSWERPSGGSDLDAPPYKKRGVVVDYGHQETGLEAVGKRDEALLASRPDNTAYMYKKESSLPQHETPASSVATQLHNSSTLSAGQMKMQYSASKLNPHFATASWNKTSPPTPIQAPVSLFGIAPPPSFAHAPPLSFAHAPPPSFAHAPPPSFVHAPVPAPVLAPAPVPFQAPSSVPALFRSPVPALYRSPVPAHATPSVHKPVKIYSTSKQAMQNSGSSVYHSSSGISGQSTGISPHVPTHVAAKVPPQVFGTHSIAPPVQVPPVVSASNVATPVPHAVSYPTTYSRHPSGADAISGFTQTSNTIAAASKDENKSREQKARIVKQLSAKEKPKSLLDMKLKPYVPKRLQKEASNTELAKNGQLADKIPALMATPARMTRPTVMTAPALLATPGHMTTPALATPALLATPVVDQKLGAELAVKDEVFDVCKINPMYRPPPSIKRLYTAEPPKDYQFPSKKRHALPKHSGPVTHLRWCTPMYSHLLMSVSMDNTLKIWDCFKETPASKLVNFHEGAVKDAVWGHDGTRVVSCGFDKTARLIDIPTGKELRIYDHPSYVTCVKFHPEKPQIFITGTCNSGIACWDTRTHAVARKYEGKSLGQILDIQFLPSGSEFLSSCDVVSRDSFDRTIMAWDFGTSAVISNQIYQELYTCPTLKLHPGMKEFVAQSNGDYIVKFSATKPYAMNKRVRFEGHEVKGYPIGCNFSPDGGYLLSGSADGNMYIYNYMFREFVNKHSLARTVQCYDTACIDVAPHPLLGGVCATCSWGGDITLWQ